MKRDLQIIIIYNFCKVYTLSLDNLIVHFLQLKKKHNYILNIVKKIQFRYPILCIYMTLLQKHNFGYISHQYIKTYNHTIKLPEVISIFSLFRQQYLNP